MKEEHELDVDSGGFSTLEVLLAIFIGVIAAFYTAKQSALILQAQSETELIRHRRLLKAMLLESVSCEKIVDCRNGEFRALVAQDGHVLVREDGSSNYGPWTVRAKCMKDQSLEIEVSAFSSGRFRKSPIDGSLLDWSHPKATLIGAGSLCGKILGKNSAGSNIRAISGEFCEHSEGSCPPPPGSESFANTPVRMCCDDGRDRPRPSCGASESEVGAYWDRDGDWGVDGKWVVLCQKQ